MVQIAAKAKSLVEGDNPEQALPMLQEWERLAQQLAEQGGAVRIAEVAELDGVVEDLLLDGEARRRLVSNARQVLSPHRGATRRTAELLVALVAE